MRERDLRREVLALLDGGRAHVRARDVLAGFPVRRCGERPRGFVHSAWQLLEHLRLAQADILGYCLDPRHRSPEWPEGYWPPAPAPRAQTAFRRSARAFLADLRRCQRLAADRDVDLLAGVPHLDGVSWLHELLLIADHNAYHLGQLMLLRRALEASP